MKSGNPLNSMLFPWMEPWTWMKRTDPPSDGGSDGGDDPPAVQPDPPAVQPSPPTVTIESGDTLSELAEEHGVTVDDLLDANPDITNADVIYAGDDITIPTTTPSPPSVTPDPPAQDDDYGMTPVPDEDVVITLPPTDVDDDPDPVVIIPADPDDPVIYFPDPPADPPAPPPWQLEYETDASGNVFYIDANGTKWTVARENFGPDNPSDELADYLAETDHPWNAVINPTMVSDATADAIDAIIADIVNTGDTVSDSPYYDIIGSDGDYTGYSFDTAFAVAREKHGGGGGTFTWEWGDVQYGHEGGGRFCFVE